MDIEQILGLALGFSINSLSLKQKGVRGFQG